MSNLSDFQLLKIHLEHPIARIGLNRPEKRNALSPQLISELSAAFDMLATDEDVRVSVLTGEGGVFCAGADLAYIQQLASLGAEQNLADSRNLKDLFYKIYAYPKFVIAQVHGAALAGGCGLATVCDVVVASDDSEFGYTETAIGFIPALVSVFLVRKIGETNARELLLSARKITAEEAYSIGMINAGIPCPQLDDYVRAYAATVARNSPTAIAMTKTMLAVTVGMGLESALEYAASMNALARATEDTQRGIAKFLSKAQ